MPSIPSPGEVHDEVAAPREVSQHVERFLDQLEQWRVRLAENISLRNQLSPRDLNLAVQKTIDRIVFLRICEDRGIEHYGQLQGLLNGPGIYKRLGQLFERADERYNSGLFHFHQEKNRSEPPDEWTLALAIDDKPLRDIIRRLYYPDSPYEFSVLGADILGQVYEQFLGKVIRLTAGGRAVIEDKPEVKKAGGVYYTPTYIVDYIVANTVGKLVEGKTPHELAGRTATFKPKKGARSLAVLDPACGSGSFLIGAYQFLLDWYRDRYLEEGPAKHKDRIYQTRKDAWRLTTVERKRIVLDHIYGVDIDPQAVEVTKLSLLLKVLEGENEETLAKQLRLFKERALPDLGNNIKCGNALVGLDFAFDGQGNRPGDGGFAVAESFDWHARFPRIARAGGFDAVIGNPPWGQKAIHDDQAVKQYVRQHYRSTKGIYDLFRPFVERGIQLTKQRGAFGMVLPDIVLLKDYVETRRFLLEQLSLERIDWWGMAFGSAVIDAATVIGRKTSPSATHRVHVAVHDGSSRLSHELPQHDFWKNPRLTFNLLLTPEKRSVLERLDQHPRLGDFFEIHEGVHSGNIRRELFVDEPVDDTCRPLLFGRKEIAPYRLCWEGRYIRLAAIPAQKTRERYANLGRPEWHQRQKVLVRRTGDHVLAAVDTEGRYATNNFFLVFPRSACSLDLDGLCALLNSPPMTWYFRTIEPRRGRAFAELKIKHLASFPLPRQVLMPDGCDRLNGLGMQRRRAATRNRGAARDVPSNGSRPSANSLDAAIQRTVAEWFDCELDLQPEYRSKDARSQTGALPIGECTLPAAFDALKSTPRGTLVVSHARTQQDDNRRTNR